MEVDAVNHQRVVQLEQAVQSHEADANDQRQRCEFFGKNSQKLLKQIKDVLVLKRKLEQQENVLVRQNEDLASQATVLQMQLNQGHMPGAFSE